MDVLTCTLAAGVLHVVVAGAGTETPRLVPIAADNGFVLEDGHTIVITDGATQENWRLAVPPEWQGLLLPDALNRCVVRAAAESF
jgi:hypothetical protein